MKRVAKAEFRMLKHMRRSDVQRRYNVGAATDWQDMLAALCHDHTGLVFEPEHDPEASPLSCPQCGHQLPEACMSCGKPLDPAEGGLIMTGAQLEKHRAQRHKRLQHMATHHPPPPPSPATPAPPPTPATPPIETTNVEEMAITKISLITKDRSDHEIEFRIGKHTPLRKLMQAYRERLGETLAELIFVTSEDGAVIYAEDTAEKLGLEDGDVILASIVDGFVQ